MISENCPFCSNVEKIQLSNNSAICIFDKYPVTKYHCLIIPRRHEASFFNLDDKEQQDCIALINQGKSQLCSMDETITGFNFGVNDGIDAGQTILHCHIHLIPRRKNDIKEPQGGVRNIIPGKGKY